MKVLRTIPDLFSFKETDYSEYLIHKNAAEMMDYTWTSMGKRLTKATKEVGKEINVSDGNSTKRVKIKKQKAESSCC